MSDQQDENLAVVLPEDIAQAVRDLSERLGESPQDIVIAAVEHFTRLPEEQRKAILRGTSIRRRESY